MRSKRETRQTQILPFFLLAKKNREHAKDRKFIQIQLIVNVIAFKLCNRHSPLLLLMWPSTTRKYPMPVAQIGSTFILHAK